MYFLSHTESNHTSELKRLRDTGNKRATDRKTGAKVPMFQVNDTVRVRRPEHVHKGSSRFTEHLTVVNKVGLSTYLLSDCWKWNASNLARSKEALAGTSKDNGTVLDGLTVPENMHLNAQEPGPRWGVRVRNPPRWLTDFVR